MQSEIQIAKEWRGTVVEVFNDYFTAEMKLLTIASNLIKTPCRLLDVHEISKNDVSEHDKPLIIPGGVFYETEAYETSPGGQLRHTWAIRFER